MAGAPISKFESLAVAALVCISLFEMGVLLAGFKYSLAGNGDFSAFYRTAVMVRTGEFHRLYDVQNQMSFDHRLFPWLNRYPPYYFYHPPFEALLLLPLAFVSYKVAFWVWSIASLAMLVFSGTILSKQFPQLRSGVGIPLVFLVLAFFPIVMVFLQGQDSGLLLLLVAWAFAELHRGRNLRAGIMLGLSLFKFQFIVPLVAMLAWRLGRNYVIAFTATAAALCGISWMLVGTAGLRSYWQMLVEGTPEMVWRMPNLRGIVESLGGPPVLPIALALALAVWCATRVAQMDSGGFALAIVCSLLVSHHGHVYDCLLLVIPAFCALETALMQKKTLPNFWPALFFAMLPVYVLLTKLHATWVFAIAFLLLAVEIARPAARLSAVSAPPREALS